MFRALTLAAALAAAAPAFAQTAWSSAPTAADMAAAYPAKARAAGVGGGVDLVCAAARSGAMTDCAVIGESPRGYGFGAAGRRLSRRLVAQGVVPDQEVRVSFTFSPELARGEVVTVKTPRWSALPSAAEMQAVVPASEGGSNNARVTLVCEVQAGGVLSGCAVDREEPSGQGFGAAILGLASKFRVDLLSAEGMPTVGARVRVPVRFDLKPVAQAAR